MRSSVKSLHTSQAWVKRSPLSQASSPHTDGGKRALEGESFVEIKIIYYCIAGISDHTQKIKTKPKKPQERRATGICSRLRI